METISKVWDTYRSCWSEPSENQRTERLKEILSGDFEYRDPNIELTGYKELSDYMMLFQEQYPGASFSTTDIKLHHNRCLIHWNMVNSTGDILGTGTSFVMYENNKLKQANGFFEAD